MDLLINLLFLGGRFLRLPVKKAALHPLTSAKGFNKFPELERRYTCLYQERCTPKSPYTYTRRVTRTVKSTKHQQVQTEQQEKKKIKDVAINTVSSNIDGIPVLRHIVVDMKQLSGFDAITTQLIQTCKPMKGETFIVPVVLTKRPLLSNPLSGLFRYHKSFVKECVKYTANRRENNFAKAALKALSAMLRTHESTLTSICTSENMCSINFFKRNLISNPLISSDVCQSSLCTKPARTTANICFIRKAHSKSGNNIENLQDIQRAKALMRNPHTFESLETKLTAIQKIFSGRSSPFNEDKGPNVAPEQEQEEKLIELNRIAFEKLENQLKQETSMRNTTVNWKEVKDQSRLLHVNENEFKKTEKEAELFSKAKIVVKKGQKIQADMNRLETSVNCPKLNFLKNRKLHSEKLNFLDYKLEKRGIVLFEKDDSLNFNYINKELLIHEISDRQSNLEAKIRMFHSKDDPKSILNICKDIKKVKQAEKKLKFPDYLTDSLAAEQEAAENEKKEKQSSVVPETSKTPNTQKETMQDIQTPLEKILNVKTGNQSVLQYVSSEDKQCALPETKAILTKVAKLPEKIDEKTSDTQEYILKATKSYTKLDSSAKNTTASKIPKMRLSKMCIRRRKTIKTRKQITSSKIPIRVHRKPVQIKRLGSKGHKENLKLSITNSVKVLFEKSLDKVKTEPKDSKPEQVKVQPKISEPSLPPKNNAIPFTQMQKELQSYIAAAIAPPKQTGESLSDESFVKYESPVLSQDTVEKQQREPYHTNVLNYLPSNIKKIDKKPTLPTNTLWNQYPKITVQPKQTKPSTSKDTQAKLYKARPRKYKYKSKEVLLSDGKKISVTYLESEK